MARAKRIIQRRQEFIEDLDLLRQLAADVIGFAGPGGAWATAAWKAHAARSASLPGSPSSATDSYSLASPTFPLLNEASSVQCGAVPRKKTTIARPTPGYDAVLADVVALIEAGRRAAVRSSNVIMTATYWGVGRRVVEEEQHGATRAEYGEALIPRLSRDLQARFGRGFGEVNLSQMRGFYLGHREILQTASEKSRPAVALQKVQTASEEFLGHDELARVAGHFPLPWSCYVRLLSVRNPEARRFYEGEALRGGWTVRQLNRQIGSQFYERTALSKNKAAMLRKGQQQTADDVMTPEEQIKDPFYFEFLGLKDEYSESDLEAALIAKLEAFLLELGGDFTFVGRQRRLRVGDAWYRIDLLFFHRRLRCLVIIDLKLNKLTHADAGQMHLYLNYAREHWMVEGENPPVGLILCAEKDGSIAHYALEGLPNKVMAAEYRTVLPKEPILVAEIEKTIHAIETRHAAGLRKSTARKKR